VVSLTKPPSRWPTRQKEVPLSLTIEQARVIATVAHGAIGQTRSNGTTPYIVHPKQVAEYTRLFSREMELKPPTNLESDQVLVDRIVAAWLHDVLEDTKLKLPVLMELGISQNQLDIVLALTKPDAGPAPKSYYEKIAQSEDAMVVKCADRCANLDDALAEIKVEHPKEPRRWERYVEKTVTDVIPMYAQYPMLEYQLAKRVIAIWEELPTALAKRQTDVEQDLESRGATLARLPSKSTR